MGGQGHQHEAAMSFLRRLFRKGEDPSQADLLCQHMILAALELRANSAREAAEMAAKRELSDKEWQDVREPWERNWRLLGR